MQERVVRFLQPGHLPKSLILPSLEATFGEVFLLGSGGNKVPDGHTGTVNGRPANTNSKVSPGDTVGYQPNAEHG